MTLPGEPKAAAKVGQNFCHRNEVKCGFAYTFLGNADVNVSMHSVRYSVQVFSIFLLGELVTFGSIKRLHSHCITGITSLYTAVACVCVIKPAGAVFLTSSASSIRNVQNVLKHCEAAAREAALVAREPNSQHSPQRDKISISRRPFNVQAGEHAIARNKRKTLTTVSSLLVVGNMPHVARNS